MRRLRRFLFPADEISKVSNPFIQAFQGEGPHANSFKQVQSEGRRFGIRAFNERFVGGAEQYSYMISMPIVGNIQIGDWNLR